MSAPTMLHVLMNTIINEYFGNSYCIIILADQTGALNYRGNIPIVNIHPINAEVNDSIAYHGHGCQDIVIDHDDPLKVFESFEFNLRLHKARFNFRRYLIPAGDMSIFNSTNLEYVVNLLVIVPDDTESNCFKLVTHQYVGQSGNNDPRILDYWFGHNQSFLHGNDLFPDKLRNQQGRTLRCATFNYKPYSIIENSPPTAVGSENAIAHVFAEMLNMTIEYIVDDKEWGIIYDNWTGDGILGHVAIDKADMGYGALYTWAHEYQFLDLSKPVVRTGITCLVPAPRLADGWLIPFFPFSFQMWLWFSVTFVLLSLATIGITAYVTKHHLEYKHHNSKGKRKGTINYRVIFNQSMIKLTQIFLIQSLSFRGRAIDTTFRYLFPIFLYSLIITATYSSGLAAVMTLPRYIGTIDTVWNLAKSDLRWGATQDAWIYSILEEKRPQYKTLLNKFVATSKENLLGFAKTNRFAFSIERLPSGQFAIGNYITEDIVKRLRLMHEDLYWEYCVFMII
ncbi:glutamate receptor isoform X2 [Photinus pyralis]|uniref:glutamate receptor isoform X2 n=1 Tax=Photinus pyralis TaxID=7054 RepID=UPI0012672A8F|nr:glutamate receptor isoform X2 [Photinus pyralis]